MTPLVTALILLSTAQGDSPAEVRLMRYPTIHGEKVVFTYGGDLWLTDTKGGVARRLTTHPGLEAYAKFSPDGSKIAFTASYDGNPDVYVMDAMGGEPKRLTFEPEQDIVLGWTPDGKVAYGSAHGNAFQNRLWIVNPEGGPPKSTSLGEISDGSFSPDGTRMAFNRNFSHNYNWRRYRGGTQGRIAIWTFANSGYEELPAQRENSWQPMWVGNRIYFISDRTQNTRNIWSYDLGSKRMTQHTRFSDADIKWPNSDGKTIIFEKNGFLHTMNLANDQVSTLSPRIATDAITARPQLRNLLPWTDSIDISPSGNRVVLSARGELFSLPARAGETRNMSRTSGTREKNATWSPDGKTIAYLSDATGEFQIYTQPQLGGEPTRIATEPSHRLTGLAWSPDSKSLSYTTATNDLYVYNLDSKSTKKVFTGLYNSGENYEWSPDSKWIAYLDNGPNLFARLYLHDVTAGKSYMVTEGYYRDDALSFDLNGKYLYLVSARTINPVFGDFDFNLQTQNAQRVYVLPLSKDTPNPLLPPIDEEPAGSPGTPPAQPGQPGQPGQPAPPGPAAREVKIDLEGLGDRLLPLPLPPGNYPFVLGLDNGVLFISNGTASTFRFSNRQKEDIGAVGAISQLAWTPNRQKFAYMSGPVLGVADLRPGFQVGAGRVETSGVEAIINPRDEWRQIFWEAWRWQRDRFYDPQMLGLDWNAIGRQYEKFLPHVAHRSDLNYVLSLMLSELGTSHAYVQGGDMGIGTQPIPIGKLGADYEVSGDYVRFKKIYGGLNFEEPRRGPLGEPGVNVKEGDYLLAIDGQSVRANVNPHSLLLNKVNRTVVLTVNDKPSTDGARTVRVRPIGSENELRYISWVEDNRRKVAQMSNGRIGYIHVPNTSFQGFIEFIKGFYSQSDKDAVIVDERYNGGGSIPTMFIELLSREQRTAFRQRNGGDVNFPVSALPGPKVMLVNEYAGSGGDMLPWLFREHKLGTLIGTRTWGGLVGITGSAPLVDGGGVTAPEFGIYDRTTGKWIAENTGVEPDIVVDARPDLVAKGQDPQLERAVQFLLDELKKPRRDPRRPDFPRVQPPRD